jgi:hypothetical protein
VTVLETRMREAGLSCRVEARERLAIIVPDAGTPTREERLRMMELARAEGFTHACVDLEPGGAPLPGN